VNSKDLEKTKKPIQNHDTVTAITLHYLRDM